MSILSGIWFSSSSQFGGLDAFGAGRHSKLGKTMTHSRAMGLSSYYLALRAISEDTAQFPIRILKDDGEGKKESLRDTPIWRMLNKTPNGETLSIVFRETLTAGAIGWGGGFAG